MSSVNHRMHGFAESLRSRTRVVAERSATLFLAGGCLLLVTATLFSIEVLTQASAQGLLTGLTGFTGIIFTYIGLLALKPWFGHPTPRGASVGTILVVLPTIVIGVLLVWGLAFHLPFGTVPSPIGLASLDLIFMVTFLLVSLGIGLFGLVSLRTGIPTWHVGVLLLALAITWLGLLVLISVFGSKLPPLVDAFTFSMMASISLSIGYFLRRCPMPDGSVGRSTSGG